jgi:hypothetical protein
LSVEHQGLDDGLAVGVVVAAAAVDDPELGERGAERAAGERRAVVGGERQRAWLDAAFGGRLLDDGGRVRGAAADVERPGGDLARAAVDRGVREHRPCSAIRTDVMSRCQS